METGVLRLEGSFLIKIISPSSPNYTVNSGDNTMSSYAHQQKPINAVFKGCFTTAQFSLEAAPLRQELATPPSWRAYCLASLVLCRVRTRV